MRKYKPPFSLRHNEYLFSYGPGSIHYQKGISFVPMSPYYWYYNKNNEIGKETTIINSPELKDILNNYQIHHLPNGKGALPVDNFPKILICKQCGRINKHRGFEKITKSTWRVRCKDCKQRSSRFVQPSNWVMICENGHLDDFPFLEFLHGEDGSCKLLDLRIKKIGGTAGGITFKLSCKNCDKNTTMASFTELEKQFNFYCTGKHPWIGRSTEDCKKINEDGQEERVIAKITKRGASNVYYPFIVSSIVLPETITESKEFRAIKYRKNENLQGLFNYIDGIFQEETVMPVKKIKSDITSFFGTQIKNAGLEINKIIEAINRIEADTPKDYQSLLDKEMIVLEEPSSGVSEDDKFVAEKFNIIENLEKYIKYLTSVKRLTEVKVLKEFSRLSYNSVSLDISELVPKGLDYSGPKFYPGVENVGEGIYIGLNPEKIKEIVEKSKLLSRLAPLHDVDVSYFLRDTMNYSNNQFVIVHTLSHALMRAIGSLTGYSQASIRERIYINDDDYNRTGILLYTTLPGSMGGYGGLSRLVDEKQSKFRSIIEKLVNDTQWCASDPSCSEIPELKAFRDNKLKSLAACHSCLYSSETSCILGNSLLDRVTIIGDIVNNNPTIGYFGDYNE